MKKLNNLEQTNKIVVNTAHSVNQASSQINHMNTRLNGHEQFLKLLAYKSIDNEARSRRRNLLFHGLAENKGEDCSAKLSDFLWEEMGIDSDDLYVERVHRLGPLQRARKRVPDSSEPVRRPIIVAFNDTRSVDRVLDSAYVLRGSSFSVTRDFPLEIVKARRTLMPQYIKEKQNRQDRVSIEYPARLVVNGQTVCDAFPDWYSVLQQDRYDMAKTLSQTVNTSMPAGFIGDLYEHSGLQVYHHTPQPQPAPPPPPPPPQAPPTRPILQTTGDRISHVPGSTTVVTTNTEHIRATVPGNRSYAHVVSTVVQQAPTAGAPIYSNTRYTGMATGIQSNTQRAHVTTTSSTASDRSGSANSTRLTDNAINAGRDQPNYQQL